MLGFGLSHAWQTKQLKVENLNGPAFKKSIFFIGVYDDVLSKFRLDFIGDTVQPFKIRITAYVPNEGTASGIIWDATVLRTDSSNLLLFG